MILQWLKVASSLAILSLLSVMTQAEISREQIKGLDEQVQDIKSDVLSISTELSLLEEKLLFPSNTQVSLFVSLKDGDDFDLDALEIAIDGKTVAHHIYTFKELQALREGGLQRIYTGNLMTGGRNIKVGVKEGAEAGKMREFVSDYVFEKKVGPGIVEIQIRAANSGSGLIQFVDR